jgi:hypothetical protein
MNCPHCHRDAPRVCGETLCCAEGVSRCFTHHPLPPTRLRLVAEILETSDTKARRLPALRASTRSSGA